MGPELDEMLINNTLRGDSNKFETLVNKYGQVVERYVRSIIHDPLDVQDILQDIWLVAYQRLDSLRDQTKFSNWIFVIARNKCRAHLKGPSYTAVSLSEEKPTYPYHPEEEHIKRSKNRRLLSAVDSLSQILKRTVTMHYMLGHSCPEVSTQLNVPLGTVKRRLADARKELRRIFKDWSQQSGHDTPGVRSLTWLVAFSHGIGCLSNYVALK